MTEDNRCSWCGWAGPDWSECEALSWHWGASVEEVYWSQWRQHLEGHARSGRGRPPELETDGVMREVRTLLWLEAVGG